MNMIFCTAFFLFSFGLYAQQIPDTAFLPPMNTPMYASERGPVVYIDEGHHNFHTREGRYASFARLAERDGYVVKSYEGTFTQSKLETGKILLISNALHKKNVENWFVPVYSAFTKKEIKTLETWVREGGSLWLIADHMPLAGAAKDLGAAFGFGFTDGFVFDSTHQGPAVFSLENEGLKENVITQGRNPKESVDRIATFMGQAFQIPTEAQPILSFGPDYVNLLPDTAWVFGPHTKTLPAKDWIHGAYMSYGKGRLVVFGEAAMFSAQLAGPDKRPMGMNHPEAKQNYQLLLNILHWLDGKLE